MARKKKREVDQLLLLLLACGATAEAAARKCGISESTVYRRLKEPAFQRQVQILRGQMLQRASGALAAVTAEAVKTLHALMTAGKKETTRLGAARTVLDKGVPYYEFTGVEGRLSALEQANDGDPTGRD